MQPEHASDRAATDHAGTDTHTHAPIPPIVPAQTALVVMHYQTDILAAVDFPNLPK